MRTNGFCTALCAVALLAFCLPAKSNELLESTSAGAMTSAECADCGQGYGCGHGGHFLYVQADALFWDRVGTGCDTVLVLDANQPAGANDVLSTDQFDFDYEPGVRVLVGFVPDPCACPHCSAWEVSYFGIFDWSDSIAATGAGNLSVPGDLGLVSNNFSGADEIRVDYDSELHSVEFNCIHSCCQCWGSIDFLAGFRYINLDENLSIIGTDVQEGTSSYDVNTNNDLYGFQMGGRVRRRWHDCWTLELLGKAGVFYNDAEQSQIVTDSPIVGSPFVLRSPRTNSDDAVAGLGEMRVTLIRALNNVWSFRVGYDVLTIGGLALAPDQLDFTNTLASGTDVDAESWIFVHGGHLGFEARW